MQEGVVLRAYSGYYYVQAAGDIYACKLRGRFKQERFSLIVGDRVRIAVQPDGTGMVEEILPRESLLTRPLVANVDQAVLTFAARNPDIKSILIDRFLVLAERAHLDIIICINKTDLAEEKELQELVTVYRRIGYRVIAAAAARGTGIDQLAELLTGKTTVFAGPSGVGKSTLLNAVQPGFALQTGDVSEKIGRGKHTTRFAQLLALDGGGYVVDTPGFGSIEFTDMTPEQLVRCFPDINEYGGSCKFSPCFHWKEPRCGVKEAVNQGLISKERYAHYTQFLAELHENNRGY